MAKSNQTDMDLLEEAVSNIREDRGLTYELINELRADLITNKVTHKEVGFTAAKYMETLQRSNEQLVKVIAIMKKEKKLVALTAFLPVLADFIEDLNDQYVFKQTLKRKANILAEEIQKVDRDILRIDGENAGKIFDEQIQLQILFRQWIEEVIEID